MADTKATPTMWQVKPTEKGALTQYGGIVPRNPDVAFFVCRLADTTTKNSPVGPKELIQAPGEEGIFTYSMALEAQRLGYAEVVPA